MEEKNNFVHGVAYGKLYLAGEYAILEDYASALITSVPKKITVFVEESDKTTIFDTINKTSVGLFEENSNFTLVQQFIKFLTEYTNSNKTFDLTIFNELHSDDKKYGLGSSGAVLVAIARAILSFENISYNDLTIFKLVALFNIKHNLSGSMGDVAASINDGITFYQKFNAEFVNEMIYLDKTVKEIINTNWDGLLIEKIHPKADLSILARWTGEAVDTKEHVKLWKEHKNSIPKNEKKMNFKDFVLQNKHLTLKEAKEQFSTYEKAFKSKEISFEDFEEKAFKEAYVEIFQEFTNEPESLFNIFHKLVFPEKGVTNNKEYGKF